MKFVMVQGGGEGIFLAPEFDDIAAAGDFALLYGFTGTVTEESVYLATPFAKMGHLSAVRGGLQLRVRAQADVLARQISPVASASVCATLFLLGEASPLATIGAQLADALVTIATLEIGPANTYDPVTDPGW